MKKNNYIIHKLTKWFVMCNNTIGTKKIFSLCMGPIIVCLYKKKDTMKNKIKDEWTCFDSFVLS